MERLAPDARPSGLSYSLSYVPALLAVGQDLNWEAAKSGLSKKTATIVRYSPLAFHPQKRKLLTATPISPSLGQRIHAGGRVPGRRQALTRSTCAPRNRYAGQ